MESIWGTDMKIAKKLDIVFFIHCILVMVKFHFWLDQKPHEVENWHYSVCVIKTRMLFPGFPVSLVMFVVSVGKIAENGPKMCHVWLQQCERQQGNCFLSYDSCFDVTG